MSETTQPYFKTADLAHSIARVSPFGLKQMLLFDAAHDIAFIDCLHPEIQLCLISNVVDVLPNLSVCEITIPSDSRFHEISLTLD